MKTISTRLFFGRLWAKYGNKSIEKIIILIYPGPRSLGIPRRLPGLAQVEVKIISTWLFLAAFGPNKGTKLLKILTF